MCTRTNTSTPSHKPCLTHTHPVTNPVSHTPPVTNSVSLTHTPFHKPCLTHTHPLSQTHPVSQTHPLSQTYSHTLSQTLPHTHPLSHLHVLLWQTLVSVIRGVVSDHWPLTKAERVCPSPLPYIHILYPYINTPTLTPSPNPRACSPSTPISPGWMIIQVTDTVTHRGSDRYRRQTTTDSLSRSPKNITYQTSCNKHFKFHCSGSFKGSENMRVPPTQRSGRGRYLNGASLPVPVFRPSLGVPAVLTLKSSPGRLGRAHTHTSPF